MDYHKLIDELVEVVVTESASDLHLSEGRNPTIRVDGVLIPLLKKAVLTKGDLDGITEVFLGRQRKEVFLEQKEVDFAYPYRNKARFRVNGFFQQGAVSFAMRLIPAKVRTLEELGLPDVLKTFTHRKQGFFLVVGPVGQGKTTTLAALVDLINAERAEHIVTIEDPIEYTYEQRKSIIDQREVGIDTKDFNTALRFAFRQDVNVIMVGEMRGLDTIATAVTAGETGHLIFSTLHTNNASQTIDRIIDSFPANQQDQVRLQLAGSLVGIFSQRLLPRVQGGQIPGYELLISTPAVANLIREGRTHEIPTILETGSEHGMIDFNHRLVELVRMGEISVETAYLYSFNPQVLEKML
jgi:twitching motility protein PilT